MGVLPYMNTEPLVVVFDVEYTVIFFFCAPSMPASSRIPPVEPEKFTLSASWDSILIEEPPEAE